MQISIRENDDTPLYQQIVRSLSEDIARGALPHGYKLPTVRDLADDTGISRGTVKHAYDTLAHMGLIEMTQGRGTFVCGIHHEESSSKKDLAMRAIDRLLNELQALSFGPREMRIFFDLKLREREEQFSLVRVGVVDCSPEAASVIGSQLSTLPGIDIQQYQLDEVLRSPQVLDSGLNIIVTTAKHFPELEYKVPSGCKLMRLVLTPSPDTVLELARLPQQTRVGIVAASSNFAGIMFKGCGQYAMLSRQPDTYLLGQSDNLGEFLAGLDVLVLPTHYHRHCSRQEAEALSAYLSAGGKAVYFDYQIDRGSLLYIGEEIEAISNSGQQFN